MKKIISILISMICVIALASCSSNSPQSALPPSEPTVNNIVELTSELTESDTAEQSEEVNLSTINIQVGNKKFIATMHNNESAQMIIEQMPFTLNMEDYASKEKVIALSFDLPTAQTETPSTINTGELYLWSGNNLVLFYTTFSNSYSYVPIGYIEDVTGLTDALGRGNVEVTFSTND